jgi:outer membrane protein assembly factor BamB
MIRHLPSLRHRLRSEGAAVRQPGNRGVSVCGCWCLLLVCAQTAAAQTAPGTWPQWRGPTADGVADPAADPPIHWDTSRNILWKLPIPGRGNSTPVVSGDRLVLLTAISVDANAEIAGETPSSAGTRRSLEGQNEQAADRSGGRRGPPREGRRSPPLDRPPPGDLAQRDGNPRRGGPDASPLQQLAVVCIDRHQGEILWQTVVTQVQPHERLHNTNTYASASAIIDRDRIYASFGSFGLYALNLEGEVLWQTDLGRMQTRNEFGEGSSPALHRDWLLVPWDHEGDSRLMAIDTADGQILWQVERDEPSSWASPLIVEQDGQWQVVMHGTNRVRSYRLESGELLWECGGQATNPIATPVRYRSHVLCTTGHRGYATAAIALTSQGDVTDRLSAGWLRTNIGSYIASPIIYQDRLYVTKGRDAILHVLDLATGEDVSPPMRLVGLDVLYASPVAAAGRLYFSARNGNTLVLEAGDQPKIIATNPLEEPIDASPVIIGNRVYLRGQSHLFCIEEPPG